MPLPKDVSTLRLLFGIINYYQTLVQNMHFICQPLDKLLQIDKVELVYKMSKSLQYNQQHSGYKNQRHSRLDLLLTMTQNWT